MSIELESTGSKKSVYIGQIIELDTITREIKVSFLKKSSPRNELYFWPERKDESWELMSRITGKLGQPVDSNKSTNRRLLFTFEQS